MPAPAPTTAAKDTGTDASQTATSWYSAFTPISADATNRPAVDPADPDPLDTLTLSDIPGPHARTGTDGATLPALLHLQHTELERLVRDNGRLMDRIETLLQIQGREQVLRQQLQNQVDRIDERIKLTPPAEKLEAETLEAVRREARAGVTEEIKPVLMAILDALEHFAGKPGGKAASAEHSAPGDPFLGEDYGKLPAILTRPLDELMGDGDDPERSNTGASRRRPRKTLFQNRKRARPALPAERESVAGTGPFTWTTVLSS